MGEIVAENAAADAADAEITKLIVAVHGIGDQFRFATIQSVARQIAKFCETVVPYPLGAFHGPGGKVRATPFEVPKNCKPRFAGLGFAEVFWADIHQKAQKTGNTIEESKAWARSMVVRMESLDRAPAEADPQDQSGGENKTSVDYRKTAAVVEEMIETIATLENLLFLAEKMGLGKFELRALLDDYLGAVQLVADFKDYGGSIFDRFSGIMRDLLAEHPGIKEIHIVAHSEGTVVTFHSLLAALTGREPKDIPWVERVRGLMTIGSPIDKHIVMWPRLWHEFHGPTTGWWTVPGHVDLEKNPIIWWNYYDGGDPVGFKLDSARLWLKDRGWTKIDAQGRAIDDQPFFVFPPENDRGFTRYYLPGKAHNNYWDDEGVFGHFIDKVIAPETEELPAKKDNHPVPTTETLPFIVSWIVPYVLCFLLLLGGTYLLYRAVDPLLPAEKPSELEVAAGKLGASADELAGLAASVKEAAAAAAKAHTDVSQVIVAAPKAASPEGKSSAEPVSELFRNVLGIACLLAGITVASRIPRLVKFGWWYLVPAAVFALGAWAYLHVEMSRVQANLSETLFWIPGTDSMRIIWLALAIAVVSSFTSKWLPHWGMKPLMGLAATATAWIVYYLIFRLHPENKELPLWPLALAGGAFLYIWWLVALIFDLTFVWHLYIRSNATPELLMKIREKRRDSELKKRVPSDVQQAALRHQ